MSTHQTLRAWVDAGGLGPIPPTIAEVADQLQVANSTARERLDTAVENGLMQKDPGKARSYSLTDAGKRIVMK